MSFLGDTRDHTELINEEKTLYSISLNVVNINALTITSIHPLMNLTKLILFIFYHENDGNIYVLL